MKLDLERAQLEVGNCLFVPMRLLRPHQVIEIKS